ncbi:MAG TPA: hypothetical protein VGX23_09615 [Actinocrinis sp.]|nr:hypothetical protein [Actinocrinis sp.]
MSTAAIETDETGQGAVDGALDAGGLLPLGTAPGERRDGASARSYRHPALADRVVVRLAPDGLGAAEDLTLEFLGFAAAAEPVPVGVLRQQSLGFPAWALVHDPANGHHALNLVKDIERLTRVAATKPGLAKEGFDDLARRLAGAVPHFLPTFYEQAARVFLLAENATLAAGFFNRAREAERAYSLVVDETAQGAAFLEFALAGALTAKALTEYSRALAARTTPELAYAQFRRICLERTAGGLPPYSALPADLRRLARAAKCDTVAEDVAFARELLVLPATVRAAAGFWTSYRPQLLRAAKADPAVRGLLLGIIPPTVGEPGPEDPWLALLEESGAVAGLTDPVDTLPAEALPADGVCGWLVRFDAQQGGRSRWLYRNVADKRRHKLLDLVDRMEPRLRAEGTALALCSRYHADIDLIDLCLGLGLELAAPTDQFSIDLEEWLGGPSDRDLTAFAGSAPLRLYLYKAVTALATDGRRDPENNSLVKVAARLTGVAGLRSVLHEWLDDQAALLALGGLVDLDQRLRLLDAVASRPIIAVNPDAFRRMAALNVGSYLGHALRSGIFDEYGWPALEQACARMAGLAPDADPQAPVPPPANSQRSVFQRRYYHQEPLHWEQTGQWPYLAVQTGMRVAVVDGAGTRMEHIVSVPSGPNVNVYNAILRYTDEQVLVAWNGHPDSGAYFSGDPARIFTDEIQVHHSAASVELPWGGRSFGGRPLTAGDPKWSAPGKVAADGTDYWVYISHLENRFRQQWVEFDPRTGTLGRASVPGFFGKPAPVSGEWTLQQEKSWLLPLAAGGSGGPLGAAGGLTGFRVLATADGTQYCEGVDGRSATVRATPGQLWPGATATAIMSFPGAAANLTAVHTGNQHLVDEDNRCVAILMQGRQYGRYSRGTWCVPPVEYWSYLTVRDESGSAALRAITDAQAQSLIASATQAPGSAATVESVLPQVTDSKLRMGIDGYLDSAVECQTRLLSLTERIAQLEAEPEEQATGPVSWLRWDKDFGRARRGLCPVDVVHTDVPDPETALGILAGLLIPETAPTADDLAKLNLGHYYGQKVWAELLHLGFAAPALAYRATTAGTGAKERAGLLEFLRLWSASPLTAPGGAVRLLTTLPPASAENQAGTVLATEFGRAIVLNMAGWHSSGRGTWYTIEYSRDGDFGALPEWRIETDVRPMAWPWAQTPIAGFCGLAAGRDPVPIRAEQARELARISGLSSAEAKVLLAGLPTETTGYGEQVAAEIREAMDLKPTVLKTAGKRFGSLSGEDCIALLAALLPVDPATLWTDGPRLEAAAQLWTGKKGRQIPLPDELITEADRIVSAEIVQGLVNPASATWLVGTRTVDGAQRSVFSPDNLHAAVRGLIWLAYRLPDGDPLRVPLPQALATLRERIADPAFSIRVGHTNKAAEMAAAFGYREEPSLEQDKAWRVGPFEFSGSTNEWRGLDVFPAELTGADDPVLAYLAKEESFAWSSSKINAVIALLGDGLERLLAAGLPADGSEGSAGPDAQAAQTFPAQDPTRSVPGLVSDAAGKLGLSPDAAALYLMLLALPDPTDRNQAAWTGWKPARLKAARAELAATDLVVEGARPRAGRTLFLPGGWHTLRAPHLPVETWKDPLFGFGPDGDVQLGLVLPRVPVAELFSVAWNRVQDGDTPRYLELTTGKKR